FVDLAHLNKVYKVVKALYGLHQAPRAWYETLSSFLLENGFRRVYVDDIIFGSTKKSMCTEFEEVMHKRFQMSSMGELTFFLGLQVKQQPDGIFISQDKYVADMFAVCACARFQVTPKASHLHAVKRIFRYLKHQPKLGLWYPRDSLFELEAFLNSDYAGASLDRKLTTGLIPSLVTRVTSLEKELKATKQTLGNAVVKLVKKVKSLETALQRKSKKVIVSESEGEEPEDQGRIIQYIDDDPLVSFVRESMKEKLTNFCYSYKSFMGMLKKKYQTYNLGGPQTLSKVAFSGVTRKNQLIRAQRLEESKLILVLLVKGVKGKKALMLRDIQATHKTKEQMRQEEAGLEEAIKLQAQLDEEVAKQIHLDKMIAKRMAEEEALTEQQKKRKAQVQFEAQFYTEED
ncbi:putative ribonuclease H-like domain-containing protein, partial [Tanacetum coccineum]